MSVTSLSFDTLVSSIQSLDAELKRSAVHAVNVGLTLRNWCIGAYISEFELDGSHRARYGERLFKSLSDALQCRGVSSCDVRMLHRYVLFYERYPQVADVLPGRVGFPLLERCAGTIEHQKTEHQKALIEGKVETLSPQFKTPGEKIINNMSFSHISELLDIESDIERTFYEIECIRGVWSVRELRRQIESHLFVRSGASKDIAGYVASMTGGAERQTPSLVIRDPYCFEFLGLSWKDIQSESEFEDALVSRIEEFLMELGHGFCFEARQKHILIGGEYYSIDLVFYHRILKCHVLVDLKMEGFSYAHAGQMNMYLNWFRENVMCEGDNPPVGIVLCPGKSEDAVRYALAGLPNEVFVSRYSEVLPSIEVLEKFVREESRALREERMRYTKERGKEKEREN